MTTTVTPVSQSVTTSTVAPTAAPRQAAIIEATPMAAPAVAVPPAAALTEAQIAEKQALFAKREAGIRRQQQAFAAEKAAYEATKTQNQANFVPKDRLKAETLAVLAEQGITYDQLVTMALSAPSPEAQKMNKLEAEIEAMKQGQQTQAQQQYEQAVNQIRSDVKGLVATGDTYEMIRTSNAADAVVTLIEKTFEKEGRVMGIDEAANEVENWLLNEAVKVSALGKVKAKLAPPVVTPDPAAVPAAPKQAQQTQTKTLTNASTASGGKRLSPRERAMLAFKNQLQ